MTTLNWNIYTSFSTEKRHLQKENRLTACIIQTAFEYLVFCNLIGSLLVDMSSYTSRENKMAAEAFRVHCFKHLAALLGHTYNA